MHFCCGELGGSSSQLYGLGTGLDGVKQYLSFGCAPEDRTGLFTGPVFLWLMEEHGLPVGRQRAITVMSFDWLNVFAGIVVVA